MTSRLHHLQQIEFETRIFVSFAIVALVLALSWTLTAGAPTTAALLGHAIGVEQRVAHHGGFLVAAAVVALATGWRMAAGSLLTSRRVMAFEVQSDALATRGPYRLSRNPIYLADWVAFLGFALVLPPIGLLLPVLLFLHYSQIIRHEERALAASHAARYHAYVQSAPRFFPTPSSLGKLPRALGELALSRDGIRHNALYVLFLPGLCVAALTGHFWHALAIGLPATLDWAVVHTRIGLAPDGPTRKEVRREEEP